MKMLGVSFCLKTLFFITLTLSFWQGFGQSPSCTALSIPGNGSNDVTLDIDFEWIAAARAETYILVAGTSSGGTDILDNIDVGNLTTYDLPDNLPAGQTIYVKIIPENTVGQNPNCAEISFTTTSTPVPDCVGLIVPVEGAVDVPIDTVIEWTASPDATGYRISIGSASSGNDILDDLDVGNSTTYQSPGGFPILSSIYVTISPYNDAGRNDSCSELRFTITSGAIPRCTQIINPQDLDQLVPVNANITWIRDFTATGYLMTLRKDEPDGEYVLREEDVGNGTNFKPPNFEPRTKYYVTMIPYNDQGRAVDCQPIMFTTGDPLPLPDCVEWVFPQNGASEVAPDAILEWNEVPNTDGFIISVGTSINGIDILNEEDIGATTSLNLPEDLPVGITIYIKINTYDGNEISENCPIISFRVKGPDPLELQDEIPKFFTPNNDGFNDVWVVESSDIVTVDKIFVFDRYGKLIKQLGEGQGWDGTFNGKNLPAASYWYSVELVNAPGLKGHFLLKR